MRVTEAAEQMKKSPEFIRVGLQLGRLPFGTAVQVSPKRWSYDIRREAFEKYMREGVSIGYLEKD